MRLPNAPAPALSPRLVLAAAALLVTACTTRGQPADSSSADAAVRGDSIGDLTGAPRSQDSAAIRAPATGATPSPASSASSKPPSTAKPPASSRPVATAKPPASSRPAADTGAQRRNDGSMMNPPIHRTNPRDDDIFRPGTPAAGTVPPSGNLLAEIRALAKPDGCASAGECQSLPVGRKACGGPRDYVVFCPKSTNVATLRAKIAELYRVDEAAAKNSVSDCMLVTPPRVTLSGGVCRASGAERDAP